MIKYFFLLLITLTLFSCKKEGGESNNIDAIKAEHSEANSKMEDTNTILGKEQNLKKTDTSDYNKRIDEENSKKENANNIQSSEQSLKETNTSNNNIIVDEEYVKTHTFKNLEKELIGLTFDSDFKFYDNIFPNLYSNGGCLIDESSITEGKEYSLSTLEEYDDLDITKYVILEEIIRKEKGSFIKILDVLKVDDETLELLNDPVVHLDICFNTINGKTDLEVIAIFLYEKEEEYFTTVYKAWRASRITRKITEISVEGIVVTEP